MTHDLAKLLREAAYVLAGHPHPCADFTTLERRLLAAADALPGWRWEYEDKIIVNSHVYHFLFPYSRIIEGVRMFPMPTQREES